MTGRYRELDPEVWKALMESRARTARHQRRKAVLRWFLSREARIAILTLLAALVIALSAFAQDAPPAPAVASLARSWLFMGLVSALVLSGCLIVLQAVREALWEDEDLGSVKPRQEWR